MCLMVGWSLSLVLLLVTSFNFPEGLSSASVNGGSSRRVFGKYGSVNVDMPSAAMQQTNWLPRSRWPEGIRLVKNLETDPINNNSGSSSIVSFPTAKAYHNVSDYPYQESSRSPVQIEPSPSGFLRPYSSSSSDNRGSSRSRGRGVIVPVRRTYEWLEEDLIISVNMTSLTGSLVAPTSTRLVPPLRWLSSSGSKVKVLQQSSNADYRYMDAAVVVTPAAAVTSSSDSRSAEKTSDATDSEYIEDDDIVTASSAADSDNSSDRQSTVDTCTSSRIIEITVPKSRAEKCLSVFRMFGFSRQDIYRTLNKGPWILSFNIAKTLPRLYEHLKGELGLENAEAVHVVSHNPYLIAQYNQYQGRDVSATVRALKSVGYSSNVMFEDVMRFPSMLSAPPDRILGWHSLLSGYGVEMNGDFVRKAPFIFNLNAPLLFDADAATATTGASSTVFTSSTSATAATVAAATTVLSKSAQGRASATASEYVVYGALRILEMLTELRIQDINKVVRTQPLILLTDSELVRQRLLYLRQLLHFADSQTGSGSSSSSKRASWKPRRVVTTIINSNAAASSSSSDTSSDDNDSHNVPTLSVVPYDDTAATATTVTDISCEFYAESLGANVTTGDLHFWNSILLSNPSILSIDRSQMRDVVQGLRKEGVTRNEVFGLVKAYPTILGTSSARMRGCLRFLKQYCDARAEDLYLMLKQNPKLLTLSMSDLLPKKDFLFQSLGGSPEMLRHCPRYLTYNLDTYIIPRAEFLRALGRDPLQHGLAFLVNSKEQTFVSQANSTTAVFTRFRQAFNAKLKDRIRREREDVRQVIYRPEIAKQRSGTNKRGSSSSSSVSMVSSSGSSSSAVKSKSNVRGAANGSMLLNVTKILSKAESFNSSIGTVSSVDANSDNYNNEIRSDRGGEEPIMQDVSSDKDLPESALCSELPFNSSVAAMSSHRDTRS